ncbi:hypothetical protein ACQZV8_01730 [Magnetococcales bacterium HHB-1]
MKHISYWGFALLLAIPWVAPVQAQDYYWTHTQNSKHQTVQINTLRQRLGKKYHEYESKRAQMGIIKSKLSKLREDIQETERILEQESAPIQMAADNYNRVHELSLEDPKISTEREREAYALIRDKLQGKVDEIESNLRKLREDMGLQELKLQDLLKEMHNIRQAGQVLQNNIAQARSVVFLGTVGN